MKKKIIIESNDRIIFKGKKMNMPIRKDAIIEKSIELFDDDDPCIIHTSYVIKHFADDLIKLFEKEDTDELNAEPYKEQLHFLELDSLKNVKIKMKR